MQDTWNTYNTWETTRKGSPKDLEPVFQKALEMLTERLPYEQKLISTTKRSRNALP
jgi:hypothetical protein